MNSSSQLLLRSRAPKAGLHGVPLPAGSKESARDRLAPAKVAGHVRGLHRQERQRRVANRVGPAKPDLYHTRFVIGLSSLYRGIRRLEVDGEQGDSEMPR
jgi:hypothetical protein